MDHCAKPILELRFFLNQSRCSVGDVAVALIEAEKKGYDGKIGEPNRACLIAASLHANLAWNQRRE
jgi:hypothetical protein